jgi:predicted Zn-dependent protease
MRHRRLMVSSVAVLLLSLAACINDPNANLSSDHPDQVLFDHAVSAMESNRFDVARMTLQTLLNTYPDSEYADRATQALQDPRMAVCDGAWMTPAPDFTVPCPESDAAPRSLPE